MGKPLENLNKNYKNSLKEDDSTTIGKIIDRTLYVRALSFAAANQGQQIYKAKKAKIENIR